MPKKTQLRATVDPELWAQVKEEGETDTLTINKLIRLYLDLKEIHDNPRTALGKCLMAIEVLNNQPESSAGRSYPTYHEDIDEDEDEADETEEDDENVMSAESF